MRIREKKNQSYDRFRYLLEFQVKKGNVIEQEEPETETSGDIFDQISGAMDGRQPVEPASVETEQPISDEVVADVDVNDNQTFEDTASDLLKIHASKIDNLTQYINDSVSILKVLSQKTNDIASNVDEMGNKVAQLNTQVDKLTPPTPLESLNNMIKVTTGAQKIEDYWNEYFAKHGRQDNVNGSLYYNDKQYNTNEKGMNSGVYKRPEISDTQISDIIKNT